MAWLHSFCTIKLIFQEIPDYFIKLTRGITEASSGTVRLEITFYCICLRVCVYQDICSQLRVRLQKLEYWLEFLRLFTKKVMKSSDREEWNWDPCCSLDFWVFFLLYFLCLVKRKWLEDLWLQDNPMLYSLLPYLISEWVPLFSPHFLGKGRDVCGFKNLKEIWQERAHEKATFN